MGPAADLAQHRIEVVADLPGVGANLQDHLEVYIQHQASQPVSVQPSLATWKKPFIGAAWLFLRRGPGATNHFEGGGFVRSNEDVAYPNLMFHFLPLAIRYDGTKPAGGHGYQVHVGPMYSDARGTVRLRSADPEAKPELRFNYLSTDQDRREWVEAIRVARRILGQPGLAPYDAGEVSPGPAVETDEQILDWVRRDAETALHPSCTTAMGTGSRLGDRPAHDAGARPDRAARGGRGRVPVRHQRQHLRARDDGRGEGRRPHRRATRRCRRSPCRSTGTALGTRPCRAEALDRPPGGARRRAASRAARPPPGREAAAGRRGAARPPRAAAGPRGRHRAAAGPRGRHGPPPGRRAARPPPGGT